MEYNIFYEYIFLIPAVTVVVTIVLKAIIFKLMWKDDHLQLSLWSGWMPSAHSSFVTSMTTAIAIKSWINSEVFAISLVVSALFIYDAINIRYEAGLHASAINEHLWNNFNESLGHLPSEAFAWSILWIVVAVALKFV